MKLVHTYQKVGGIMHILGGILIVIGISIGIATLFDNNGVLSCITSIIVMTIGTLLFEVTQRQEVASSINDESHAPE